jgi:hypothetical protein
MLCFATPILPYLSFPVPIYNQHVLLMENCSLAPPDEALLRDLPLPLGFSLSDASVTLILKSFSKRRSHLNLRAMPRMERTIRSVVSLLAGVLHLCHRNRIWWPIKEIEETVPRYYQDVLVGPVLSLFNQMRYIPDIMEVEYRQKALSNTGPRILFVLSNYTDERG